MPNTEDIRTRLSAQLAASAARVGCLEADREAPLDGKRDEQAIWMNDLPPLDELGLALLEEMRQTREALRRLDAGIYGTCQACGSAISDHRLAVLPAAKLCIDCEIAGAH
jgi:RNA polymerase-binding transcription factor DksA